MPAIAPISRPQNPAHDTTTSAGKSPWSVRTPVTRPPSCRTSVTRVEPTKRAPREVARSASTPTAFAARASPSVGVCSAPKTCEPSSSGQRRTHSSASIRDPWTPHDVAQPCLRLRSSQRAGVVATSMPPTWRKQSSSRNFETVYFANSVIVLDAFVWNTRPGACDVDPPVRGSGPWSSTVTSAQPRAVSSSARFAPTMPAPMITTVGAVMAELLLPEDDGAVAVEQDAAFAVPADRAGQGERFGVAADGHQLARRVGVVDALDLLLDDRALVEVGRDVVRGRADVLDTPVVGLVVGLRALEPGQERVVDVDRAAFELLAQLVRQHLHVPGEHDQVRFVLADEVEQPLLGLRLGLRRDRDVHERDPGRFGHRPQVLVIGNNGCDMG